MIVLNGNQILVPYGCKTMAEAMAKIAHNNKNEIIVTVHNKPEKNTRYDYLDKTYSLKELYNLKKRNFPLFLLGCLTTIIAIPIDILIKLLINSKEKL